MSPPAAQFAPDMFFPADRSLARPEDGVCLPDGRLVVSDQVKGLRLINEDGSNRAFGNLAIAGYQHHPPLTEGAANGIVLEPGGRSLLVCDLLGGGIYRVDLATEKSSKVYKHHFGVNAVWADRLGGIWFTQSSHNTAAQGQAGLRRVQPFHHGALWYLPVNGPAVLLVDALNFANGLVLDEDRGTLYLAETLTSKIWRFTVDVAAGRVSDRALAAQASYPDNITLDRQGRLWIAAALRSEIIVYDPQKAEAEVVFRVATPASEALISEIEDRVRETSAFPFDQLKPALWNPGPGMMTGVILSADERTFFITCLGNSLLRIPVP